MATGLIATRPTKVGDVLKHEYDPCTGYCRKEVIVIVPAGGLQIGAVLENTTNALKYQLVANSTLADSNAIVIDTLVNDEATKGGDFKLAVLVKGPSQVADDSLSFASDVDTDVKRKTAFAALDAKGIEVLEQV